MVVETLPEACIKTIFRFLDYESRIHLNQCLKPQNRVCKRFSKSAIVSHEICVVADLVQMQLDAIEHSFTKRKQSQTLVRLLQTFEKGRRSVILLQTCPRFCSTFVQKLYSMLDANSDDISSASTYFKRKIKRLIRKLLTEVPGFVYVENIGRKAIQVI